MLKKLFLTPLVLTGFVVVVLSQEKQVDLNTFHRISSHDLLEYAVELSAPEYGGRLSGSPGYQEAASWTAGMLKQWGLKPLAGDTGYLQWFPNPYTEVLNQGSVVL